MVLSGSGEPEGLQALLSELGPRARAATSRQTAEAGDFAIVATPISAVESQGQVPEVLGAGSDRDLAVGQTLALIIPAGYRARHVAAFHTAMDTGQLAHDGAGSRVEALAKAGGSLVLGLSLGLLPDRAGAAAVLRPLGDAVAEFVPEERS